MSVASGDGLITRIFPQPATTRSLRGLYLTHDLRGQGDLGKPLVYTNFITSLDGRISERGPGGHRRVPAAIANPHDWRLYLELMAQADVVLTTARHLRGVAAGREEMPGLAGDETADLVSWRRARGLAPTPAIAVVSAALDLPVARLLLKHPGPLLLLTNGAVEGSRVAALEAEGAEVLAVGAGRYPTAREILAGLSSRGYRCIYSIAGPRVFHTLVAGGALDRLYLTIAQTVIGGSGDTLLPDAQLPSPASFALQAAYCDSRGARGVGQLFLVLVPATGHGEPPARDD